MTYTEFLLLLFTSISIGLVIGLYLFGNFKNITILEALNGFKKNFKYVLGLGLILLAIVIENATHTILDPFTTDYTPLICALSMNGAIVEAVQTFRTPAMDMFFIVIYIYFYIFMLLFTPLLYAVRDDKKHIKQYMLAMLIAYAIMMTFYLLFPVKTTGQSGLINAYPVLYSNPNLLEFVLAFDPLDNCFPSGHVAGPVLTTMLLFPIRDHKNYKRFAYFTLIISALVIMSVIYLGIHWEIDVIAGIGVAFISVWLVRNKRFRESLDTFLINIKFKSNNR
ncbi:MAG: phosphatase PAP2 family protein [Thermoplasmata archaeon]|nr:phosphatase PAP2 family protein [Thermoplasmata archaeon]